MSYGSAFGIFEVVFFLFFFGVLAIIFFGIIKRASENAKNNNSPVVENEVRAVSKRTQVTGNSDGSSTYYYVTFEFCDGSRGELRIDGKTYGMIAEGDVGILKSQGTRFLSFDRRATAYDYAAQAEDHYDEDVNGWHKCEGCGATFRGAVCDYCGTPWKRS